MNEVDTTKKSSEIEITLKKKLSMPETEINTFIGVSDTIGAVAKGVYLTIISTINAMEHYGKSITDDDLYFLFSAGFHRITEQQMTEALMILAEEGLLNRSVEDGEWCINSFDNDRNTIELQKLESLFKRS